MTTSSGGVVVRRRAGKIELLLINDNKYPNWMLPKGHVEKNESLEEAALREIQEETGVSGCRVVQELGKYTRYKEEVNEEKTVYIYLIIAPSGKINLRPEYDHMQVAWFPLNSLPPIYVPYEEQIIKENTELISRTV